MNCTLNRSLATLVAGLLATSALAAELTIPNSFSSGSPARASEVNDNFSATADAVNDNDARIAVNESQISGNSDSIAQLSAASGVAYAPSTNSSFFVSDADTIVKTMTISAPVDGHAVLTFSSWFICTGGSTCVPRCSVDEGGSSLNTTNFTLSVVPPTDGENYDSLTLTTAMPLTAGDHIINVVCDCFSGQGSFGDVSLTATFSVNDLTVR